MGGGGKGGRSQSQTTKVEPWGPAAWGLVDAVGGARDLYANGGFAPQQYQGSGVAGFGQTSQNAQQQMINRANGGTPGTDAALGSLTGMVSGQNQYNDLQGVRDQILGSAIPAATAQFAGSGLTNSSVAYDGVGQAATAALAPFEYDAYNQQQGRALQAASMIPGLERAQYLPSQMLGQVGAQQDTMSQAQLTDRINRFNQNANSELNNFNGYLQAITGLGGMGQAQTGTSQQPGQSGFGQFAGSALGGLGAYGALAANPVTAPFALGGGLLAGLGGLF